MKGFFAVAPGALWVAIILGLGLLAEWLTQYFGAVTWVAPVAGLLIAVIVPILKVLATNQTPAARALDAPEPAARSKVQRFFL